MVVFGVCCVCKLCIAHFVICSSTDDCSHNYDANQNICW